MHFSKPNRLLLPLAVIAYCVGVLSAPYVKIGIEKYVLGRTEVAVTTIDREETGSIGDLGLFNEAYRIIRENYYGFDSVSRNDLVSGMIKGTVDSLGDRHSNYFDIDETKKFNETLSGDFEGIGAVVDKSEFGVSVKQILAGSPAKEAGVLTGDIISKAGGNKLEGLDLTSAIDKIRGPAGTVVELEILRVGESAPIIKKVTRRKITVPSVDAKMIEGTKIAHITLAMFGEKTSFEFLKSYTELKKEGAKALILDLRDNGGGLLETAVNVLSNFVPRDKLLVTTKEKNPFLNHSYFSYGPGDVDVPVVVLVNENSASASEITAGALKDYERAVIVGTKTYGKGSVQQPFALSDGSELKITVAKWYTPLDHGIDKVGIEPDIPVAFEKDDFDNRYDRQLEEAKKIAERLMSTDRATVLSEYAKRSEAAKEEEKNAVISGSGKTETPKK